MPAPSSLQQSEAVRRAALISETRYTVSLQLSAEADAETFRSTTRIEFDCAEADAETFLDLTAARVESISVNGSPLPARAYTDHRIRLSGLRTGHNTVDVVADAFYMNSGVGLHRKVDPADGRVYLYSHFEPFEAHRVFACFNQPDIKGPFALDVVAPAEWLVMSNNGWYDSASATHGATTSVRVDGASSHIRFSATKPLPPYLMHLTAGPYVMHRDEHNGLPLLLVARHSQREVLDRNAAWIFAQTKEGLDLFHRAFGFDYQFSQYGQAFVPEFNAGAMENPGCVTFNDRFMSQGRASRSQMRRLAEVILHEMAHVYGFGDVTTMTWWDDLHLNETFATFMSYYTLGQTAEFRDDAWVEFAQSEKTMALAQDQLPSTHPVKATIASTAEVSQLFDEITYAKGACVIRQLFALIGEDAFFKGLREYFAKHWFANATQADFLNALGTAAGRDLGPWGNEWMGTASVNTLRPAVDVDGHGFMKSIRIEQSAPPKYPTLRTHRIAIGLFDLDGAGRLVRRRTIETDISGAVTTLTGPDIAGEKRPAMILVNDLDLTYAKIRFDQVSLRTLRHHVAGIEDPLARTVVWTALWDMTRDAELPAREYIDMVASHIHEEREVAIMERLLGQAALAANQYCEPSHRAVARTRLADVANRAIDDSPPGSDRQLSWLRWFISFSEGSRQLDDVEALLDGERPVDGIDVTTDVDLRWQIILRLAAAGRVANDRIASEVARDPSDAAQRRQAAALASRPHPGAKQDAWQSVMQSRDLPLATARAICGGVGVGGHLMGGFHQPGQDALIDPYVTAYLDAIPGIWATREENEAEDITETLFPRYMIAEDTVRSISKLLRRKLPYAADRILRERRDTLKRALRAQRADAAAQSRRSPNRAPGGRGYSATEQVGALATSENPA